jgi:hypothetical protein
MIFRALFFCLLFGVLSANIWDNIFGNFKAPAIIFPKNFKTQLLFENNLISLKIHISFSSIYRFLKTKIETSFFKINNFRETNQIIFNLNNDTLFYHDPDNSCKKYLTPKLLQGLLLII